MNQFRTFCKRHLGLSAHQIKDLHSLGSLPKHGLISRCDGYVGA